MVGQLVLQHRLALFTSSHYTGRKLGNIFHAFIFFNGEFVKVCWIGRSYYLQIVWMVDKISNCLYIQEIHLKVCVTDHWSMRLVYPSCIYSLPGQYTWFFFSSVSPLWRNSRQPIFTVILKLKQNDSILVQMTH